MEYHPKILELKEQVAYLKWQRQQKDRSIKLAVEHSKALKQRDTMLHIIATQESDRYYKKKVVVESEYAKPLEISLYELNKFKQSVENDSKRIQEVSSYCESFFNDDLNTR